MQLCYPTRWTPIARGNALSQDLLRMRDFPPRLIEIEDGEYDFGLNPVRLPGRCEIRGQSRKGVRISSAFKFVASGDLCTVQLDYDTVLNRMSFLSTAGPKDQVCGIGFRQLSDENAKPFGAEVIDVHLSSKSWGFYFWNIPAGNTCKIVNCYAEAANVALGPCRSSGGDAQFIDAWDSQFVVKPELSDQGGAVTHPVYGGSFAVACRGGRTRLFNCLLEATGESSAPRLCGVTDIMDEGSASATKIELHNTHIRLTKGKGEKEAFDIDVRKNPILVSGGTGTSPDGIYSLSPTTRMVRY